MRGVQSTVRSRQRTRGGVVYQVWAVAERRVSRSIHRAEKREVGGTATPDLLHEMAQVEVKANACPVRAEAHAASSQAEPVEIAIYRKYTEAMLRRYGMLSMEAGRVPSMLGREMFRGRVTSYRVRSFDDVVIFCHDVETCLKLLSHEEQQLVKRIAVQSYTHSEAAAALGLSLRSGVRQYARALDRLTRIFLEKRMLERLGGCQ